MQNVAKIMRELLACKKIARAKDDLQGEIQAYIVSRYIFVWVFLLVSAPSTFKAFQYFPSLHKIRPCKLLSRYTVVPRLVSRF
jgi:hypothetical protein